MTELVIACLSQKGGVGKSTMARLIAQTYASADWRVKIADFNVRQLTSVDWVAARMKSGIRPEIAAEPYRSVSNFKREPFDLIVADGKPDSDVSSLEIARVSNLVVLATGLSFDDIKPQLLFAGELISKGVKRERILFVLNKVTESDVTTREVRQVITSGTGYVLAQHELLAKTGYQVAQNAGRSVAETFHPTLNDKAIRLGNEIIAYLNGLEAEAA